MLASGGLKLALGVLDRKLPLRFLTSMWGNLARNLQETAASAAGAAGVESIVSPAKFLTKIGEVVAPPLGSDEEYESGSEYEGSDSDYEDGSDYEEEVYKEDHRKEEEEEEVILAGEEQGDSNPVVIENRQRATLFEDSSADFPVKDRSERMVSAASKIGSVFGNAIKNVTNTATRPGIDGRRPGLDMDSAPMLWPSLLDSPGGPDSVRNLTSTSYSNKTKGLAKINVEVAPGISSERDEIPINATDKGVFSEQTIHVDESYTHELSIRSDEAEKYDFLNMNRPLLQLGTAMEYENCERVDAASTEGGNKGGNAVNAVVCSEELPLNKDIISELKDDIPVDIEKLGVMVPDVLSKAHDCSTVFLPVRSDCVSPSALTEEEVEVKVTVGDSEKCSINNVIIPGTANKSKTKNPVGCQEPFRKGGSSIEEAEQSEMAKVDVAQGNVSLIAEKILIAEEQKEEWQSQPVNEPKVSIIDAGLTTSIEDQDSPQGWTTVEQPEMQKTDSNGAAEVSHHPPDTQKDKSVAIPVEDGELKADVRTEADFNGEHGLVISNNTEVISESDIAQKLNCKDAVTHSKENAKGADPKEKDFEQMTTTNTKSAIAEKESVEKSPHKEDIIRVGRLDSEENSRKKPADITGAQRKKSTTVEKEFIKCELENTCQKLKDDLAVAQATIAALRNDAMRRAEEQRARTEAEARQRKEEKTSILISAEAAASRHMNAQVKEIRRSMEARCKELERELADETKVSSQLQEQFRKLVEEATARAEDVELRMRKEMMKQQGVSDQMQQRQQHAMEMSEEKLAQMMAVLDEKDSEVRQLKTVISDIRKTMAKNKEG